MLKVVLINGPAGSGKDTFAELAVKKWGGKIEKMSAPLKAAYKCLNPEIDLEDRSQKEMARRHLIDLSEHYVKPRFGKDWFGKMLIKRLPESGIVWVSDSRFSHEAIPILNKMVGKVAVVRVYRGDVRMWSGDDSGHYLNLDCPSFNLHNDGPPEQMIDRMIKAGLEEWLLR